MTTTQKPAAVALQASKPKKTPFQRKQDQAKVIIAKLKASQEETAALLARLAKEYGA